MSELLFYLSLFIVVIGACVVIVARFTEQAPQKKASTHNNELVTFETIMVTLEVQDSSYEQLQRAVQNLFDHYEILKLSNNQKRFFLFELSKHRHTRSELILSALNDMTTRNPELKKELESSVKRGLDRRDLADNALRL